MISIIDSISIKTCKYNLRNRQKLKTQGNATTVFITQTNRTAISIQKE